MLHRRLALLRDREYLRVLYQPNQGDPHMSYAYTPTRLPQPFSAAVVERRAQMAGASVANQRSAFVQVSTVSRAAAAASAVTTSRFVFARVL